MALGSAAFDVPPMRVASTVTGRAPPSTALVVSIVQ